MAFYHACLTGQEKGECMPAQAMTRNFRLEFWFTISSGLIPRFTQHASYPRICKLVPTLSELACTHRVGCLLCRDAKSNVKEENGKSSISPFVPVRVEADWLAGIARSRPNAVGDIAPSHRCDRRAISRDEHSSDAPCPKTIIVGLCHGVDVRTEILNSSFQRHQSSSDGVCGFASHMRLPCFWCVAWDPAIWYGCGRKEAGKTNLKMGRWAQMGRDACDDDAYIGR
ncbi:hypothetical protein B0T14DRAFT_259079 [Immersiella caudata]|uniref:Uncharacterized protein n=1 Tax=Immersiella caudata TaxID=314043 RepID=A0AA39WKL8_9PEZI|nr:hypothetical protein B0T14DRAFT_259079 [Immersiella caudata]